MARAQRSKIRGASLTYRLSEENKAALVSEAQALGISVQALLDRRILGIETESLRPGRPSSRKQPEKLFHIAV